MKIMGIVNVTPDSFSDGGRWHDPAAAIAHGEALARAGADILDIGGESTRPGSTRPSEADELDRVLPVVAALARAGHTVSIDTMRAEVARAALDAGARLVNDVSGGLADPDMLSVVADAGVDYIAMHWRGHGDAMQQRAQYDDVVADVRAELDDRIEAATRAGIDADRLVLDPGLGFAKTPEHNWQLMAALTDFTALPYRILVGASRKTFLGALRGDGEVVPPEERDVATSGTSLLCAQAGVWCVRVHDVTTTATALAVHEAVTRAGGST
ncbi:MAG: dihydropteroate synthase [Mobilicoccus sp.]|nr:dihydropteroate synthase [Mobilicoccus sp.]